MLNRCAWVIQKEDSMTDKLPSGEAIRAVEAPVDLAAKWDAQADMLEQSVEPNREVAAKELRNCARQLRASSGSPEVVYKRAIPRPMKVEERDEVFCDICDKPVAEIRCETCAASRSLETASDAPKPSTCPKCGSPERDAHPLTGRDDTEVRLCLDGWHRQRADAPERDTRPQRYDLVTNYRCGDAIEEMEPSDDGEWVRYADVLASPRASAATEMEHSREKALEWVLNRAEEIVRYESGSTAAVAFETAWGELPKAFYPALSSQSPAPPADPVDTERP
jgi:hypothetical protein